MKRLKEADPEKGGGLYCGPLRLLALEIYENLNKQGVYTSLVTGQEKRDVPSATHISSTLEMVSLKRNYDVVVIDEIQMIADKYRGYAWTRALLGVVANEIHVCGGLEAVAVVKRLAESTGDEFELKEYSRLSQLKIADTSLRGDYSKVQPGDCIVAFSKADIFSVRRTIEKCTPYKCAIIYGQLPPETRSTQARLFNEEGTGYDILVASDAIGMGLNLNIRRIIFHTTVKGGSPLMGGGWVEPTNIKQIAGRAGRLSSNYQFGEVTAWQEVDLAYVKAVMSWDIPQVPSAGIFPTVEQIQLFSQQFRKSLLVRSESSTDSNKSEVNGEEEHLEYDEGGVHDEHVEAARNEELGSMKKSVKEPTTKKKATESKEELSEIGNMQLTAILEQFMKLSKVDGQYSLCDYEDAKLVSNWLHSIPLSIADRFIFSTAPVNSRDMLSMNYLYKFAAHYALGR